MKNDIFLDTEGKFDTSKIIDSAIKCTKEGNKIQNLITIDSYCIDSYCNTAVSNNDNRIVDNNHGWTPAPIIPMTWEKCNEVLWKKSEASHTTYYCTQSDIQKIKAELPTFGNGGSIMVSNPFVKDSADKNHWLIPADFDYKEWSHLWAWQSKDSENALIIHEE